MHQTYDSTLLPGIAFVIQALEDAGVPARYTRSLGVVLGIASQVLYAQGHPQAWSNVLQVGLQLGMAAVGTQVVANHTVASVKKVRTHKARRVTRAAPQPVSASAAATVLSAPSPVAPSASEVPTTWGHTDEAAS